MTNDSSAILALSSSTVWFYEKMNIYVHRNMVPSSNMHPPVPVQVPIEQLRELQELQHLNISRRIKKLKMKTTKGQNVVGAVRHFASSLVILTIPFHVMNVAVAAAAAVLNGDGAASAPSIVATLETHTTNQIYNNDFVLRKHNTYNYDKKDVARSDITSTGGIIDAQIFSQQRSIDTTGSIGTSSSNDVIDNTEWMNQRTKASLRRQQRRIRHQNGHLPLDDLENEQQILKLESKLYHILPDYLYDRNRQSHSKINSDMKSIASSSRRNRVLQEVSSNPLAFLPFWVQIVMIGLLLLLSAMFSGLTLGFLGLDITGLEVVIGSDNVQQSAYAKKVLPIRKYGNLLLCTLIFGNVAVNSLLSILMADKIGGITGFIASTVLIVIFGEILPQAACARYALAIGSASAPLVKFVVCLFYPIAKPLAIVLDCILGQELLTIYNETEMLKFLQIHVDENAIDKETAATMGGAIRYKNLYVKDTMTPIDNVYMISCDDILNFTLLASIFKSGYSRIPIYQLSKHNIVGLLFVKDLIFLDPDDNVRVLDFIEIFSRQLNIVWYDDKLGTVLRELKQGKSHMALVRDIVTNDPTNPNLDPYYIIRGIITLEDIIEIILGDDIVDETDLQIVDDSTFRTTGANNYGNGATTSRNNANGETGNNAVATDTGRQITTGVTNTFETKKLHGPLPVSSTNDQPDNNVNTTTTANTVTAMKKATSMSAMFSSNSVGIKHNNNRRLDWGRLRSLDSKFIDEVLNDDEVHAIVAHLQKNYSQVFALINEIQLYKLVSESRVVVYDPTTDTDTATNQYQSASILLSHSTSVATILPQNKELVLYTKETVADTSLLILSGKVSIVVGESNFTSDVSSWYLLCPRALQVSSYVPDFTAYVKTVGNQNKCRCLQITKSRYDHAIDASSYERIGILAAPIIPIPETNTLPSNSKASSSRSILLTSSSTSSSNLALLTTVMETIVPVATKSTVTKSTIRQQKEHIRAAATISEKAAIGDTSLVIKSKGSSDSDSRTSMQKFQDALIETSLLENISNLIEIQQNKLKDEDKDLLIENAIQPMEGKEETTTTPSNTQNATLDSYDLELQSALQSNAILTDCIETRNSYDESMYDIPDEATPFDEEDDDDIK